MAWDGVGAPIVGVSHDLTTLANAKEYLRAGDDDDALIGNLIDRASAEIETICGRYFNSTSYATWYDGTGDQKLYLDHWPVTAVTRVSSGRLNVLGVRCSSSTVTHATARVTSSGLILIHTDNTGTTTTTLSFGTYTTLTALAAQVNAVGSGWSALDLSYGDYLTTDLAQTPALYCLNRYAYLPHPQKSLNDYVWDGDSGRLYYTGGFVKGIQNIYVEYTGGFTTIPYGVEQACLMLIAYYYFGTNRDPGLQSEKLGDYAWSAKAGSTESFRRELLKRLEQFMRISV